MQKRNILVDKLQPVWALKGPGWSLPIIVEWPESNDMAAVAMHPDITLLKIQVEAINKRLDEYGYRANGKFWVLGYKLVKIAEPVVTENLESIVEWRSVRNIEVNAEMTPNMKDFIDDFCKSGWSSNPYQTKILWAAMCRHMLHWLLVENRTLDLGFVDLYAPPLRVDWRTQFIKNWSEKRRGKLRESVISLLMNDSSAKKEIEKPDYLASMIGRDVSMRRVEVIHKASWWRSHFKVEKARLKSNYWHEIKALVQTYRETALRSLRCYIHEVLAPIPFRLKKGVPRVNGVPENWVAADSSLVQIEDGADFCAITVLDKKLTGSRDPFDLDDKTEGL